MAFKTSQLQNIKICQQCNGYGVLNPNDPISSHRDCPSCTNDGVYISKGNETYVFGMPGHVNYKSRKSHLIARIGLILVAVVVAAIIIFFVIQNA